MWRLFTRAAIVAVAMGLAGLMSISVAAVVGKAAASPQAMKPRRPDDEVAPPVLPPLTAALAEQAPPPPSSPSPAAPAPVAPPVTLPAVASAAAPTPPAVPETPAQRAVVVAMGQIGKPYRFGGLGPSTFDCSGLTKYAYGLVGIQLPHSAAGQYHSGTRIARGQLQPGDLIFWRGLGHVGIYVGGGRMVHAPATGLLVTIASIDQGGFYGAVRPAA